MPFYSFLDAQTVEVLIPLAKELGVPVRFATEYVKAGSHEAVGEYWKAKRTAAVRRILASSPSMWRGNVPTRQHVVLAMWAFSPHPVRLSTFIEATRQRPED